MKRKTARASTSTGPRPPPASQSAISLERISKGKRAQFHDQAAVDQLFAVVTALAAEMSVAFDRIDTLERVLSARGVVATDGIENYLPDGAAAAVRAQKREELIQRVFAVFESYAAPRDSGS